MSLGSILKKAVHPIIYGFIVALALAGLPAFAGQGFFLTFNFTTSNDTQAPVATIQNVNYKNWVIEKINNNTQIVWNKSTYYTEHCEAVFSCEGNKGNSSLKREGVYFTVNVGTRIALQLCISKDGAITSPCGESGSHTTYDGYVAGCHPPNGGFTCTVQMKKSGDQIAITYTIGVESAANDGKSSSRKSQ